MNLILFEDQSRENLLPLTFTKPTCELRVGIFKIREKWEKRTGLKASFMTQDYLQSKFPASIGDDNLFVNGGLLPGKGLLKIIKDLKLGDTLKQGNIVLAARTAKKTLDLSDVKLLEQAIDYKSGFSIIDQPWKIFSLNGQEIESDLEIVKEGRQSSPLSETVNVIDRENIFVEEGFKGEYFTVNASSGPVYLGKDSEIMEGSVIRGPFALCEHSTIKLASKIYGPTTIGPHSKAGGEINNSMIQGYSNKGHDGFLGNSVIGEWCNLGADTNNSNLKNNYSEVKLWNYREGKFSKTGLQFCGLIMGDHSKCAINTMFNTGTVVGVSANIFGAGFPRNFIPSFTWGGPQGLSTYKLDKAIETMELVLERRDLKLAKEDREMMKHIFELTEKYRARL